MKDPSAIVRKTLRDKIAFLGYTVYDRVPDNAPFPYVWLTNQSIRPNNNQDEFGYDCQIDVVVVTGFMGDDGGWLQADQISDAINTYCLSRPAPSVSGYNAPVMVLDNISTSPIERTESHIIYSKTIRYSLTIFQNSY
ncbi:MAG: DUF3168 domain-containing protein [Bacteroidales bacterium]|nr:DUF3168 domain-containing protein [Bacteroidales bacterium]